MRGSGRAVAALALLAAIGATAMPAHAAGSNEGTAFVPRPVSEPRYEVGPTTRHTVRAGDGAALALDVTLPAGVDHPVPVILMATPYLLLDATDASGSRHDCASPSVLRFFTPSSRSRMLNVREGDEPAAPLASAPARLGPGDGGGLAQAAVCDDAPSDPRRSIHGRP